MSRSKFTENFIKGREIMDMDDDKALLTVLSGLAMHAVIGRGNARPDPENVAQESLDYAIELLNALENHFESLSEDHGSLR